MSAIVDASLNRSRTPGRSSGVPHAARFASSPLHPGPTPIIGRENEMAALLTLLRDGDARFVTLTGPAGVGKTRLAEEVASRARRTGVFEDGVVMLPLETLRDATLVLPAIGSAIGLDHPIKADSGARLANAIGDARLLLVLDTIEKIAECAPSLSQLLAECSGLKILATSRRSLNIRAEHVFQLEPLALPVIEPGMVPAAIQSCPSVHAFVQFARARRRDFVLTSENASAIASICHHLDGLPLALELAAARMVALSPDGLLCQLQSRADILAEGPIDLAPRHRRMHDAIAWSYELLAPVEQWWFRRLSILEGNFDLPTIQVLGDASGAGPGTAFNALTELVRASLIVTTGGDDRQEPCFRMLGTIRTFGLSLLSDSGEIGRVRRLHALYILGRIQSLDGVAHHDFIAANASGIRAALTWAWCGSDQDLFLRLIVGLEPYWRHSADLEEGWLWMERAVDSVRVSSPSSSDRVTIMLGASTLARRRADFRRAESLAYDGLHVASGIGCLAAVARAQNVLGAIATQQSAFGRARELYRQALSSHRQGGDLPGEAVVLHNIALVTLGEHDLKGAIRLWEEAMPVARRAERKVALIAMLRGLGAVRLAQGRTVCAATVLHEALLWSDREHDPFNAAISLALMSMVAAEDGNLDLAATHGHDALMRARSLREPSALVLAIVNQVGLERQRGAMEMAEVLLIEAHELASRMDIPLARQPVLQAMGDLRYQQGEWRGAFEQYRASLHCWQQGCDVLPLVSLLVPFADAAWRLGEEPMVLRILDVVRMLQSAGLSVPSAHRRTFDALCEVCGLTAEFGHDRRRPDVSLKDQRIQERVGAIFVERAPSALLSDREQAVLGLLVEGHTNVQMAERLFVSPHTVNTHVRRIYQKMGVNSRSAATRYAMERGMVARPSART